MASKEDRARAAKRAWDRDQAEREQRNLARRAKRAGLTPKQLADREWLVRNPLGFELG